MTIQRRPLSNDETQILNEIQDFWGPQNEDHAAFISDSGDAVIFVKATDGSQVVVVNLTNLGEGLRDGRLNVSTVREWVQGPLAPTTQDRVVTVFMPLLDEDVEVWRPVVAEALPSGWYRVRSVNEQAESERWAFSIGSVVVCEYRLLEGKRCLVVTGVRP